MTSLYARTRIHQIFGANTNVGKTVLTTALVRASLAAGRRVFYLKPVSTGPMDEADDLFINKFNKQYTDTLRTACLYRYHEPVSPHLAVKLEDSRNQGQPFTTPPTDNVFRGAITNHLSQCAGATTGKSEIYVETAGGVHSPTLSGTSQADAYAALRLPTILIGDANLGGISATISAFESLLLRGYDIDGVMLFHEERYRNSEYLEPYFNEKDIRVFSFAVPPERSVQTSDDMLAMDSYFSSVQWGMDTVIDHLDQRHTKRIEELETMPRRALDSVWWPFVQHGVIKDESEVTVIDSAHGDFFSVFKQEPESVQPSVQPSLLQRQLDGSASWWTQTFGHAHPSMSLAAARAAGRYGHVMFPQAIHKPALKLAETMLEGPGRGWASRVFFSDDGSTGMEIAIKMALRSFTRRNEIPKEDKQHLGILGLKGSYHGDTIGAMNACDAGDGVYTCEWHTAKGFWFDPPSIAICKGRPTLTIPQSISGKSANSDWTVESHNLADFYDVNTRLRTEVADLYRDYVRKQLHKIRESGEPTRLAAVILEPLVLGAGGMIFVDPLFQRVLVDVVREMDTIYQDSWRGLPIIFDEVFVGLFRLGMQSCTEILGVKPDIAVYAKTLTGGTIPLALTLANKSIFDSYLSTSKSDALLHGHSYTAHAIGCEVANESLSMMKKLAESESWKTLQKPWNTSPVPKNKTEHENENEEAPVMWSFWDPRFVNVLSHLEKVVSVMTLGTVLAVRIADTEEGPQKGYRSFSAQAILDNLKLPHTDSIFGVEPFGINYRTLGDVGYFMASLNTPSEVLRATEQRILDVVSL